MTAAATLLERTGNLALFHRPQGPVDAAMFLIDAHIVAATLPDGQYFVNLCRDRYAFAVAFAAGLIRGRTALLNVDLAALPCIADAYPGCSVLTDTPIPACPLPLLLLRALGQRHHGTAENPAISNAQLAAIVFTSGSTGAPVPHEKRWGALVARTRAAAAQFSLDGASIIGTVPPQHMYGFETTVLLPLHAPVSIWCGPAFFPGDVRAALTACPEPRILVTTPLQLRALLQTDLAYPSLAACISATAPLDETLAASAEAAWSAPVLEIFGATECGSIASRRAALDTAWTAYPGITLTIGNAATTVQAPHAEPVDLSDMLEPAATGFRLLGRRTDVIKLAGRRASLHALNQLLTAVPGVVDGTFVIPDDLDERSTARLVAVVVAPSRTALSILADLRRVLDPIFMPRRIIQVASMPRNEMGKLSRQALLRLLAAPA